MSEKRMKNLENDYINNFFMELAAQLIVVGGTGHIANEFRKEGGEMFLRHCFPNGIEFKIHNRRVLKGTDDPFRKKDKQPKIPAPSPVSLICPKCDWEPWGARGGIKSYDGFYHCNKCDTILVNK